MHNRFLFIIIMSVLTFGITGCESLFNKDDKIIFRPLLNKNYDFLVSSKSTTQWNYNGADNKTSVSVDLKFTLKSIKHSDSSYICSLKFNDYKLT